MNGARIIAFLVAAGVGWAVWRADRESPATGASCLDAAPARRDTPVVTPPVTTRPREATRPRLRGLPSPDPPYHGMAIQVYSADNVVARYGQMIREIAELGADTVLFSLDGFQKHVESTDIRTDPKRTPTDDEWLELFDLAHNQGLRIVLMPKILLSDPRGNEWRGKIQPTSWDAWFDAYRRLVVHYATLAERGHVEVFIVGSELVSTEKMTDEWRRVIAEVRDCYHGRLSYSANWDHYRGIQFWGDLDLIGMTSYHRLSDNPGPSLEDLRKSWVPIKRRILEWQAGVGKPLLFTEAGWCSQEGCSVEAWNYYRQEKATPAGMREQADCYQAFIEAWSDEPAVGGILWWEWSYEARGELDYGYTPKGKPAERLLRDFFRRQGQATER
jgi:hypothetical protein